MDDSHRSRDQIPLELLDWYLVGEITESERARVVAWLSEDPRRMAFRELARREGAHDEVVNAAWRRVESRTVLEDRGPKGGREDRRARWLGWMLRARPGDGGGRLGKQTLRQLVARHTPNPSIGRIWHEDEGKIAVSGPQTHVRALSLGKRPSISGTIAPLVLAIAAVLALAIGIWPVSRRGLQTRIAYTHYAAPNGQVARLTLADGTRLTLSPNSHVGIAKDFTEHRDVVLSGEGYFEVNAQRGSPFLVHTGLVTTRVLGTAFDITHYLDDRAVRVVVLSGKVAVSRPKGEATTVVAGTVARVTDSTAVVTAIGDAAAIRAWTRGTLDFHDAPVHDVLRAIDRWYGVHLELADTTMASQRIDVFLGFNNVRDVIATLEMVLNVTATHTERDDMIMLYPRPQVIRSTLRQNGRKAFSLNTEVGR